ncbi:DUF3291 domain-containing protein [Actinoplanes sp. NPDC051494]|uniref:DUF3291 domain-containing protein n=1 Tax=Actinoplanes sp. NPDC051494 TaxID=3363907 RepID=UPI0037BDB57F
MRRLAFSTCAVLKEPYDHPATAPFDELTPQVYATAERHPAFVCRADYADDRDDLEESERDWGSWGPLALPSRYRTEFGDGPYRAAQTLSVWTDLQGVRDFVYSGLHLSTLKRRDEWFQPVSWPTYVVWWIGDELPTWQDAADRLDLLADLGPTPRAFDLRHAFDSRGPVTASGRPRRDPDPADVPR